jgi:hypothetical protein
MKNELFFTGVKRLKHEGINSSGMRQNRLKNVISMTQYMYTKGGHRDLL